MSDKKEAIDPQTLKRWRLLLNLTQEKEEQEDGQEEEGLTEEEQGMAEVLHELYGEHARSAGISKSQPKLHRWLGDIRTYFPTSVVRMMQKDAMDRYGLEELLLEPEILEAVEPDVHLVATILSLQKALPDEIKESARKVVQKVVDQLQEKLQPLMIKAVKGRINRTVHERKPNPATIDWNRVIRANLKHYQPEYKTIIPEKWYGYGHKQRGLKNVILLVDQSASMSESVIYASIYAAVLAQLKSLETHLIFFDTSVVDMTYDLKDPVDLLFGAQLGGGTLISKALKYAEQKVRNPRDTHIFLISDMDEGGDIGRLIQQLKRLKDRGVHLQVLLNLSDEGKPYYSERVAKKVAALDIPAFACTPDQFPDIVAEGLF